MRQASRIVAQPAFTPLSIDNSVRWFTAGAGLFVERSSLTTISTADALVGTWRDRSTHQLTITAESDGQRPQLKAAAINGLPAVRFSGSHVLTAIDDPLFNSAPGISLVACVKVNTVTTSGTSRLFWAGTNSTVSRFSIGESTAGWTADGRRADGDSATIATGGTANTSPVVIAVRLNYLNGGRFVIFRNGVSAAVTAFTGTGSAAATNSSRLSVGALHSGTAASFFNGDIAELVLAPKVLTDLQFLRITEYLAAKYAVSLTGVTFAV